MQNNISNYIPNWGGKKGSILKQDTERLLIAVKRDSQELIEGTNGLKHWKKRRQETFLREKKAEEWATTIYADDTLSESNGNPPYYPPVPKYTIPEGRRYSSDEIVRIHAFQKNAFIQHNIIISKIPIPTEEMNRRLESIYAIYPGILENTIFHEEDVDLITGFIQTPICTIPETMIHVGYMVGILVPSDGTEPQLTQIYIYKNAALISKLLGFLSELKVSNMNDLKIAQEYLQTISA